MFKNQTIYKPFFQYPFQSKSLAVAFNLKEKIVKGFILENNICKPFLLPKEFIKRNDIKFFYFSYDYKQHVYFLQLRKTNEIFVKGSNFCNILGLFNEGRVIDDWTVITDKRLQNIIDIKTNYYNTLFFKEDGKIMLCGRDTKGELYELTLQNGEEITKVDLTMDGIIILTKLGNVYFLSETSFESQYITNHLIKINNHLHAKQLQFKNVINLFALDIGIILLINNTVNFVCFVKDELEDRKILLNDIEMIFPFYNECYLVTKKNEVITLVEKNSGLYFCLQSEEIKKETNQMSIRNILQFKEKILIFYETKNLIHSNFFYPFIECKIFQDLDIIVNN
ncbi:hypothetical protein ABK040_010071 [Willaertia magna]